jgi:diadenosine tetraphosphate (Ap4A) HIT family hydrolase
VSDAPCFICDKHARGDAAEGGVLYEDDLVYAGHMHTMGSARVYRGYLMVEPKRHVAGLGELSEDEAAAVGRLMNRAARVLRDRAGADHVFAFVYGTGVPHLHVHVAPRYPGTPREYWGPRIREWSDAPTVDPDSMRSLITDLRSSMEIGG